MNILTTAYCEHYRLNKEFASVEILQQIKSKGYRQVTPEEEETAFNNEKNLRDTIAVKYGQGILDEIEAINNYISSIKYDYKNETVSEWYNKTILMVKEKFPLFEEEKIKVVIGQIAYNYSK